MLGMRHLALTAAMLMLGCDIPHKLQVYTLSTGQADVFWIYHDRTLARCYVATVATGNRPVCVRAPIIYWEDLINPAGGLKPPTPPRAAPAAPRVEPRPKAQPAEPVYPQPPDYTR